jgi:EAL domain-containing protein (putative c-di-GMP-specific phosphodiesterase class I)
LNDFIDNVLKLNANIAIDDFGEGYSNFSRIVDYKADIIKIDGSLIKNIDKDETKQSIVQAIVSFAKKENKKTVAEFVENEEIYEILLNLGVDYSQGYYFSKPLMPEDV